MRVLFSVFFFITGCAAQHGQFIDRGLFNNSPFVTGRGASADEAKAHALAAVPTGFEVDSQYISPVMSCGLPGEAPVIDEKTLQRSRCPSGQYRVDVALLPKEGEEREAILRTREAGFAALDRANQANEPVSQ